jgi:hypothetical protein
MKAVLEKELGGDLDEFGSPVGNTDWILDRRWDIGSLVRAQTVHWARLDLHRHFRPLDYFPSPTGPRARGN